MLNPAFFFFFWRPFDSQGKVDYVFLELDVSKIKGMLHCCSVIDGADLFCSNLTEP